MARPQRWQVLVGGGGSSSRRALALGVDPQILARSATTPTCDPEPERRQAQPARRPRGWPRGRRGGTRRAAEPARAAIGPWGLPARVTEAVDRLRFTLCDPPRRVDRADPRDVVRVEGQLNVLRSEHDSVDGMLQSIRTDMIGRREWEARMNGFEDALRGIREQLSNVARLMQSDPAAAAGRDRRTP